jgi:serine/arginine repetitive matrix protein 2
MADLLSSPDPLNDFPAYQSPAKPRLSSRPRHSLPAEGSSPTKQTFELDVGNQLSPQKIRVTVEAGNSDTENAYTHYVEDGRASPSPVRRPVNRRRERTTTTTVPVKGLSDSEEESVATPKRGRGRPRKSLGTPVPAKKRGRASTPTQKAKGRRKSISTLTDDNDAAGMKLVLGEGVEVGRGKGRSRSRSIKGAPKSTPAANPSDASDRIVSSTTSRRGGGRRKTLMPDEVVVLDDAIRDTLPIDEAPEVPSPYSTIRSTTTAGYSEPDITIARFDGMDTPRQTGWSSPRVVDGTRESTSRRQPHSYPSPSKSPETTQNRDDSVALVPVSSEKQVGTRIEHAHVHEEEGEEEEDGNGAGYREFDTILESEGFSMISVDSVPSLRGHISSPLTHEQVKDSAKLIRNKNILVVQAVEGGSRDDSFSSIPEEILDAATPGRKTLSSTLISVPDTRINDSFSSIPPEILEVATPARKTKASKLLETVNSCMEDSFSSIAPEILDAATPGRELKPTSAQVRSRDRGAYQDSFSAISPAVLEAATPVPLKSTSTDASIGASLLDGSQRILPSSQPHQSSSSKRLPTPDATPPPLGSSGSHEISAPSAEISKAHSVSANTVINSRNDSSILSQMRSSPPSIAPRRYTYTAHLRQQRDLFPDKTQTPSIVFSSPSLPPPIQAPKAHVSTLQPEQVQGPKLSPTLRAGVVLQGIVVPSSPRGRAQSLGSPFKSPLVERKTSSFLSEDNLTSPTQPKRAKPLPRLDLAGNLSSDHSKRSIWNSTMNHEDPFSNSVSSQQRSPSPEEKQEYTLEVPEKRRISNPRLASVKSEEESLRSDDAMSWQAEEEVPINNFAASAINSVNSAANNTSISVNGLVNTSYTLRSSEALERKWAAERAAVRQQSESANKNGVVVVESDDESDDESQSPAVDGDADLGLLLETLNSSSPAVQAQPKLANAEKPRRSKIPSPWRKNSKRLIYNDELSHLSSPSAIAGGLPERSVIEGKESVDMDLSEFIIPQKASFKPRVREQANLDLSALLASSPNKAPLPVLSRSSHFTDSFEKDPKTGEASTLESSNDSASMEQLQPLESIPQKIGFIPRSRDRSMNRSLLFSSPAKEQSTSLKNGNFGVKSNDSTPLDQSTPEIISSPSEVQPLVMSSPSRTNTLPMVVQRNFAEQISSSEYSHISNSSSILSKEETENQDIERRTLKWTETVRLAAAPINTYTSPTKSCLRSPLKTPTASSGTTSNGSSSKNVAFVSSSPIPSSPTTEPLSASTWSRDHWTLLDSILQTWKPENQKDGEDRRRRNSIRVISNLLGKNVNCNGEKLKLQQWHLEVVDEFRGHVGGWQETDIAKRVFALLVGEEKRGLALNGRTSMARVERV